MYIRNLTVNNWMIHRATTAELFPVTVFVGPNNGGKSALFDALLNFSMVSRGRLSQAFGQGPYSFAARRHRGAAASGRIGYTVEMSESKDAADFLTYHITYSQQRRTADTPKYAIYDESLADSSGTTLFDRGQEVYGIKGVAPFVNDDTSIFAAIRHAQIQGKYKEGDPLVSHCAREISRINKFRLDPSTLARPSRLPDTIPDDPHETRPPRLDYSGDGLASV